MSENKLKYCGKCPFLLSALLYHDIFSKPRYHKDSSDTAAWIELKTHRHKKIVNRCAVSQYYFGREESPGSLAYELLDNGINPRRKGGCLILVKHIISTLGPHIETKILSSKIKQIFYNIYIKKV